MAVTGELAAEMLAQCARHCCICRRFRPLHLQVHHIIERRDGGGDELENLIAICVSCHSDVHSNTKLTRRFTSRELKLHRENVVKMVAEGKLPASEVVPSIDELSASVIRSLQGNTPEDEFAEIGLPFESLDVLLSAVVQKCPIEIIRPYENVPFQVRVGRHHFLPESDLPAEILYPDFIVDLVAAKLVKGNDAELLVTESGYLFADDVLSANSTYMTIRAKCRACQLHFVVCTWYPERHSEDSLYCPECGQHSGNFLVWTKKMFGYIFQMVPGSGQEIGGSTVKLTRKRE